MNIKIDLVISASSELLNLLQLLTSGKSVVQTTVWKDPALTENGETEIKVVGEIKKGRTKKADAIDLAVAQQKETIEETIKEETKTDLTQEMIIADAVPKSKAGHKDKIKAKVTELGYESITDLQPVHFDEFFAFLQTIPKPA